MIAGAASVSCVVRRGRITSVSDTSREVSGFPPERYLGRLVFDVIHPDDRPLIMRYFAVGWTGEIDVVVRLEDADGSWTWRRVRGSRTIDASGEPTASLTLQKVEFPDAASR
jgi:PAS domain S-box-containing protein